MRLRWIAVNAIVCGIAGAAIVALLVPTHSRSARAESPARPAPIVVRPPRGPDFMPYMLVLRPQPGTVKIEQRLADPRGGPPYALRVFRAERLAPIGRRPTLAHMRLLGHELCAQLGRIHKGRFGWIDAKNVFRPARFDYRDAPIACGDRWRDDRSHPQTLVTTLITDPSRTEASAVQSIAWGFGGSQLRSVTLHRTATTHPRLSARGAFLVVARLHTRPVDLEARYTYEGRPPVEPWRPRPPRRPRKPTRLQIPRTLGTGVLEARAPDPGGGVAWGVLGFRADTGGFCATQPGRIVDDRVGSVNFALATFSELPARSRHCGVLASRLPPRWPAGIGTMYGSGVDPALDPSQDPDGGRVALRTLPGRTVLFGAAKPGVKLVTIESPRDVRTLIPSARARSFLAVYDGSFPTGQLKLTATFADGSQKTVTQPAGFGFG
ncbi:MAG TPA: hypothetical protein VF066_02110 [Thermoleophilaceae bacterium]